MQCAKRSWELQQLQKLKTEEEDRLFTEGEDDLFTYTREDAYNMVGRPYEKIRRPHFLPAFVCYLFHYFASIAADNLKASASLN